VSYGGGRRKRRGGGMGRGRKTGRLYFPLCGLTNMKCSLAKQLSSKSKSSCLNVELELSQTSLFVERILQFPILSHVVDINPYMIMTALLE
jgi:hypothetical protein